MATLKVTLQKQNEYSDGYPLIIRAFVGKKTIQFSMGVRLHPHQLRADGKVVKHNDAFEINKAVTDSMRIIERVLADMDSKGMLSTASTADIKLAVQSNYRTNKTEQAKKFDLSECYDEYMKSKSNISTHRIYLRSKHVIQEYCDKMGLSFPTFDTLNHAWLLSFYGYLSRDYKQNSIASIMKCLKAVYNYAIANEYTTKYPFRKFTCTHDKESPTEPLNVEQIKMIRDMNLENERAIKSRDAFMLSFYLAGINSVDLYNLKYDNKYISYKRQKTGAKIKFLIPDEVRPYMEKYKDPKGIKMFDFGMSEFNFRHNLGYHLKKMCGVLGCKNMYMYVARHSFATIGMQECDLSYSDIGQLLGHQEHSITSRYARPSEDKKNRNIRKILDTLL